MMSFLPCPDLDKAVHVFVFSANQNKMWIIGTSAGHDGLRV
jgi:hypothetical protein